MKKLSIALILCAISISTVFACHIENKGICQTKAYFIEKNFYPFSIYQIRPLSDTAHIIQFTTGATVPDSVIEVDIPIGTVDVKIQYRSIRYDQPDSYSAWGGNFYNPGFIEMIDSTNGACGTLPVTISGLRVKKIDNDHVQVVFNAETQADHYLISKSKDSHTWEPVATIKINTSGKYDSGILSLVAGTVSLSLLLIPLIGFKRNRRVLLIVSLIFCLFYVGCKKESVKSEDKTPYKVISVQAIDVSGQVIGDAVIKSF